jgi:hypothetical protein
MFQLEPQPFSACYCQSISHVCHSVALTLTTLKHAIYIYPWQERGDGLFLQRFFEPQ